MARTQKNLAKSVAVLAATALLEKALQKAAEDPRIRRKAKAIAKAVGKRAKAAGKKIAKVIKKRTDKAARATKARRKKTTRA